MRLFNKQYYYFDEIKLDYIKATKLNKLIIMLLIKIGLLFFYVGFNLGLTNKEKTIPIKNEIKPVDLTVGCDKWKDSVFNIYTIKANLYLSRDMFKETPIKGEMLSIAARNAYDSTGIIIPVELVLAQCQWESSMGREGRSPKNNPFNVGEYDKGTILWFDNTFDGIQAYYYLMCTKYLKCSTIDDLFKNFVNCQGLRYASGDYEHSIPKQYRYIKRWLELNYKPL